MTSRAGHQEYLRTIDDIQYSTGFAYDQLGHITRVTYPDNDQANYAYDEAGNMLSVSNSASVPYATFSGFNAIGQPNRIGFYNGVNTTLTYDTYTNRLTELSTTTPGDGKVQDFLYGYDNNGNIADITDNVE